MQDLANKGMRLRKPRELKLSLRPCVFDWLEEMCLDLHCHESVLARGIIEDAYDRYCESHPDQEVPGNV